MYRQIKKEWPPRRLLARHEVDAVIHQFPVDLAPHLFGVRLYDFERLAPPGFDDLRPVADRNVERLCLMALTDHPECIRCGMCVKACPTGAVSFRCGLSRGAKEKENPAGKQAVEK